MVIIDWVSKQGHFVFTHTMVTVLGSAWLYLQHVWKLHGLPQCMLLDWGSQFVAEFMHKLYHLLGITISSLTAYHPQSNGQTVLSVWQEDTILRPESPTWRFRLQGGSRTWLQLLRSCTSLIKVSYFKQRRRVLAEILNRRSNKSEDRNSGECTQEMRGDLVESFVDIKLESTSGSS